LLPRDAAATTVGTPEQQKQIVELVRQGLDEGGLGIGMGIAYVPKASREELLEVFHLAAQRRTPIYVHMRNSGPVEPGVIDALQEVLANAAATGAPLHIVHITSTGIRQTPLCLRMIEGAQHHGLDVTTEAYPYTAGMTDISSAVFDEGWPTAEWEAIHGAIHLSNENILLNVHGGLHKIISARKYVYQHRVTGGIAGGY